MVSRSIEKSGVFGAGESVDPRGCGVGDVTPSGGGGFQFCEVMSINAYDQKADYAGLTYCFPALYSSSSF